MLRNVSVFVQRASRTVEIRDAGFQEPLVSSWMARFSLEARIQEVDRQPRTKRFESPDDIPSRCQMNEDAYLRALHDAAKEIARAKDEGDIARSAAKHACRTLAAEATVLLLAGTGTPTAFFPVSGWPEPPDDQLPVLEALQVDLHCIVRAERPLRIRDMRCSNKESMTAYADCAFAPLELAERLLGLLGVRRDVALDSAELEFLCALASITAAATDGSRSLRQISSLKDGLEVQVEERTRELTSTLSTLKEARASLVESESQAMLGGLAAGIVHELNSPLGTLRSTVDSIFRALDRARECATACASGGDPMAKEVMRVLEVACELTGVTVRSQERIDEVVAALTRFVGLDQAVFKPVDVRTALEDVILLLAPRLGGSKPRLDCSEDLPSVPCYPAKLNHVFLNLLDNATTATESGGTVEIHARKDDSVVRVELVDTGPGIPSTEMVKLFELGIRKKKGRMGLRLGLPLSKRYLQEIGGTIDVASEQGSGTRVTVTLPIGPCTSP